MVTARQGLSRVLFAGALFLGCVGLALQAADQTDRKLSPKEVLDPLLEQVEWKPQWVDEAQAYHVIFKGPDVWLRVSGDYILVQSYLGRVPREASANDLLRLLRKNYDLYQGKFAIDKDMDLWFSVTTSKRLLDSQELSRQIAFVADAAAGAADLIKTQTPTVPAGPRK